MAANTSKLIDVLGVSVIYSTNEVSRRLNVGYFRYWFQKIVGTIVIR